jgi:hypothetical protein
MLPGCWAGRPSPSNSQGTGHAKVPRSQYPEPHHPEPLGRHLPRPRGSAGSAAADAAVHDGATGATGATRDVAGEVMEHQRWTLKNGFCETQRR